MTVDDLDVRLWRIRRGPDSFEAHLRQSDTGWSLQFSRNGRLIVDRLFQRRHEAVRAAKTRLREFQRAGWNEHW
jgi:hypothetical protein